MAIYRALLQRTVNRIEAAAPAGSKAFTEKQAGGKKVRFVRDAGGFTLLSYAIGAPNRPVKFVNIDTDRLPKAVQLLSPAVL